MWRDLPLHPSIDRWTLVMLQASIVAAAGKAHHRVAAALPAGGGAGFRRAGAICGAACDLRLGEYDPSATANALIGNGIAVLLAFWMRLSIETYPGIRASYVILPTAAAAHAVIVVTLLLTRLPYDRIGLTLGFLLHVAWYYGGLFLGPAPRPVAHRDHPFRPGRGADVDRPGRIGRCSANRARPGRPMRCDRRRFRGRTCPTNGRRSSPTRRWPGRSSTRSSNCRNRSPDESSSIICRKTASAHCCRRAAISI